MSLSFGLDVVTPLPSAMILALQLTQRLALTDPSWGSFPLFYQALSEADGKPVPSVVGGGWFRARFQNLEIG